VSAEDVELICAMPAWSNTRTCAAEPIHMSSIASAMTEYVGQLQGGRKGEGSFFFAVFGDGVDQRGGVCLAIFFHQRRLRRLELVAQARQPVSDKREDARDGVVRSKA
jgi:hypothetical protein